MEETNNQNGDVFSKLGELKRKLLLTIKNSKLLNFEICNFEILNISLKFKLLSYIKK